MSSRANEHPPRAAWPLIAAPLIECGRGTHAGTALLAATLREDRGVWLALFTAGALRVAWALAVDTGVIHTFGLLDSSFYVRTAEEIWAGRGYNAFDGAPTAYFPPGYPFVLSAIVGLFGVSPGGALFNALLGVMACLGAWAIGVLVHGPRAGRIAAWVMALLPGHVIATSALMSDPLFAAIVAWLCVAYLLLRLREPEPTWAGAWRWGVLGAAIGVASLVRGPAVLMPIVVAALIWLEHRFSRTTALRVVLVACGFALAVAPWSARNQRVLGAPILIASAGAYSFFNAHNPLADGGQSFAMAALRKELFPEVFELERPAFEVELERAQKTYAFEYLFTHPLEELGQVPLRLRELHSGDAWAVKWIGRPDPEGERGDTIMLSRGIDRVIVGVAHAAYFVLLALAAIGVVRIVKRDAPATWLVPVMLLYFHALHGFVFFGAPRFHTAFLPLLAVCAGVAVAWREPASTAAETPIE